MPSTSAGAFRKWLQEAWGPAFWASTVLAVAVGAIGVVSLASTPGELDTTWVCDGAEGSCPACHGPENEPGLFSQLVELSRFGGRWPNLMVAGAAGVLAFAVWGARLRYWDSHGISSRRLVSWAHLPFVGSGLLAADAFMALHLLLLRSPCAGP